MWSTFRGLVTAGDIEVMRGHTSGTVYKTTEYGKMKIQGEPVA